MAWRITELPPLLSRGRWLPVIAMLVQSSLGKPIFGAAMVYHMNWIATALESHCSEQSGTWVGSKAYVNFCSRIDIRTQPHVH